MRPDELANQTINMIRNGTKHEELRQWLSKQIEDMLLIDDAPEIRLHTVSYRGTAVWQDETDVDDVYIVLRCSECGKESPTEQAFPFCPHCGRRMIGVVKCETG